MSFFGNRLTEFRFHYFSTESISLYQTQDSLIVGVETADKQGDLVMHLRNLGDANQHPAQAGFDTIRQEKDELVQLFHAYAYNQDKGVVYDLEIERGEWDLQRLTLVDGFSAFFQEQPFTQQTATPDSMIYIQECHYVWKPMVEIDIHLLE